MKKSLLLILVIISIMLVFSACKKDDGACAHENYHYSIALMPSCDYEGIREIYCEDCHMLFNTEPIPATGHNFDEWECDYSNPPTCTQGGLEYRNCATCYYTETRDVAPLGHNKITVKGYPADCYTGGLTDGIKCERCGDVFVEQIYIPYGHTEGELQIIAPTEISEGLKYIDCLVCGTRIFEEVIPYIGDTGITYTVNESDMTCVITGPGSFTGTDLVIPDYIMSYRVIEIAAEAFKGTSLKSITIPTGVTKIGNKAFNNCNSLVNVTFKEGNRLTHIGNSAFDGCSKLESFVFAKPAQARAERIRFSPVSFDQDIVTIPESVTYIGDYAFRSCSSIIGLVFSANATVGTNVFDGCSHLSEIVISEGVTALGQKMFNNCGSINYVEMASSVTALNNAFYGVSIETLYYNSTASLKNLGATVNSIVVGGSYVPDGILASEVVLSNVTNISDNAFKGNTNLTSIVIPASVQTIGKNAFYGCTNLASVTFAAGSTLTTIDEKAFYGCTNLESITFADGSVLKTIGASAFNGCSKLAAITIPESVISIGELAFYGCIAMKEISVPFIGDKITNPSSTKFAYIFGNSVPASLESIRITGGQEIAEGAFSGLSNIKSVYILTYIKDIGKNAFAGCSSLTSITLPFVGAKPAEAENTHFGYLFGAPNYSQNASYVPKSLKTVVITNGSFIDEYAFYECSSITSVTITNNTSYIGAHAFEGCSGITSIVIPKNVTHIGDYAFSGTKLTSVSFEEASQCYVIGNYAFYGLTGLTSFTIPQGVTEIGSNAFAGCTGLTSIAIPSSVTSIGYSAFKDCSSLESVSLPFVGATLGGAENTHLGYIFGATSYSDNSSALPASLKTVVITGGNAIEAYAFANCTNLRSITIPNSVTSIGESAFYGCSSLESVSLPFVGATLGGAENTHLGYIFGASSYYDNNSYVPASLKNVVITGGNAIGTRAFAYCANIKSITIPNSVTSIGESAFYGCSSIESMSLPFVGATLDGTENIHLGYLFGASIYDNNNSHVPVSLKTVIITNGTSIGDYAFSSCSSLTKIIISNTVTHIGNYAFQNCVSLNDITIPNSVISIGNRAFLGCNNLTSITIPNSVVSIGNFAFYSTALESVTFEAGSQCTTIGDRAFSNITSLTSIVLPNSVTDVGSEVFSKCTGLTSVTLSSNLNAIGDSMFQDCVGLTSIIIPDSVRRIGKNSFRGSGISNITIPSGVLVIDHSAFYDSTSLTNVTFENGSQCTTIGMYAFTNCAGITSITIPDSVTVIDQFAFASTNLTSITIPKNVTTIGDNAFWDCTKLTTLSFAEGSKCSTIGHAAFSGCTVLANVTIPNSVKTLGMSVFQDCKALKSIVVPDSVIIINSSAFRGCSSLESITLPFVGGSLDGTRSSNFGSIFGASSNVHPDYVPHSLKTVVITGGTIIDNHAFYSCGMLTSITLPDTITSIGESAFNGCTQLTSLTIPDGVTTIGEYAFYGCTNITSIIIPNSVTSIGDYAFPGSGITSVTFESGSQCAVIGNYAFHKMTTLTNITIPSSVTTIGDYAFSESSLTSFTFENGSQPITIGAYAFYECNNLTDIVISNRVTSIGNYAFYECYNLTSVTFEQGSQCTTISDCAFYYCTQLASITLPDSVRHIGSNTFYNTAYYNDESNWENNVLYIGNHLIKAKNLYGEYAIKEGTISIANVAFSGTRITGVTIPSSIIAIGESAFSSCVDLLSVTIPESVTTIGHSSFAYCSSLVSISVDEGNDYYKSIDGNLYTKDGKTLVQYAEGKTNDEFTIPYGVTHIGDYAFSGCSTLKKIIIPDSVTCIGKNAFRACSNLNSITIPSSVTFIDEWAFSYCESLLSIVIPDSVKSIGFSAFYGCNRLESITIPFVGGGLNAGSNHHFAYIFGESRSSYDNESYGVPKSLHTVIITRETNIASYAFKNCKYIQTLILPKSITKIEYSAFSSCYNLYNVYYTGTAAEWAAITIGNVNTDITEANIHYNYVPEN